MKSFNEWLISEIMDQNQNILKDTPTKKLVKWTMPDIQREMDELQRTAAHSL